MNEQQYRELQAKAAHESEGADERLDILSMFHISDDEMTVVRAEVLDDKLSMLLELNGDFEVMLSLQDAKALLSCLTRGVKFMESGKIPFEKGERACATCGKTFTANREWSRFCCLRCKWRASEVTRKTKRLKERYAK